MIRQILNRNIMRMTMKITAIGDVICECPYSVTEEKTKEFKQLGLSFGSSILAKSAKELKDIRKAILPEGKKASWNPGGSMLNALRTMASLGDSISFCTVIGQDQKGKKVADRLEALGICLLGVEVTSYEEPLTLEENQRTARSICYITKDSVTGDVERTMQVFLGIASSLTTDKVREEYFEDQGLVFIEGYNCYHPGMLKHNFDQATSHNCKIILNLPTHDHLRNNLSAFKEHTPKVKYLFGNLKEYEVLTGTTQPEEIAKTFGIDQEIVMTNGAKGCFVKQAGSEIVYQFEAISVPVEFVVDPTAAGDIFAACYLHARLEGKSLEDCVELATLGGSFIIQNYGTELTPDQIRVLRYASWSTD